MGAPIRIRAHHLNCMLTYVGRGYGPTFVAAMDRLVIDIAEGASLTLVVGPDVLCDALDPSSEDAEHCRAERNRARDQLALRRIEQALERTLSNEFVLTGADLETLRNAFGDRSEARAECRGCEWSPLCDRVSNERFRSTRLLAAESLQRGEVKRS